MKRVLITGMSGTGKSTLICELAARGYKAIDTDTDEWSEWVAIARHPDRSGSGEEPDWVWREDRIQRLLSTEDADVLFVSGCKSNQGKFYGQFDHIVLLSAPVSVLMERLATRTTNAYGKHPDELARILGHLHTVEPRLRRTASLEVDTSAPVEQVIQIMLSLVPAGARTGEMSGAHGLRSSPEK
jgi:shikimate kinase